MFTPRAARPAFSARLVDSRLVDARLADARPGADGPGLHGLRGQPQVGYEALVSAFAIISPEHR